MAQERERIKREEKGREGKEEKETRSVGMRF
jgi:hypothetical protein